MKSNITKIELEEAIARIQNGRTTRIPSSRRISVRAVEDEAGLGDGSAYYYTDIIEKIKSIRLNNTGKSSASDSKIKMENLKAKLKQETGIKEKYRNEILHLKERLAMMAKTHNELAQEVMMYKQLAESLDNKIQLMNQKFE